MPPRPEGEAFGRMLFRHTPVSANGHLQGQQGTDGIDEHLLENLDQYSDEEVNSLLTGLLAQEEVGEK